MSGGNSRKRFLAPIGAAAVFVLAASGCSASPAEDNGGGAEAEQVITVGTVADVDTLFPWKATQFFALNMLQTVYGTLTEFDQNLNVVPGLAESTETSEDGLTVTFNLRSDVVFHDGSAFDSADVLSSLEQIQDEATAAVARASLASVTAIEAPDEQTVVLTLSTPDAALPAKLASGNMAILSSDDTEELLTEQPNGTGPFAFDSRTANQSITLIRNDDYWGDPASLEQIHFTIIPEETSIVSALQSGNVQLAVLSDALVAQTAEGGNVTVAPTSELSYYALQLNASEGVLGNVNVRLAIQCAIERQEVLDTAALGEGKVVGPITSPAYPSDPSARPCPSRDLDRAQEYLEAAGEPDGVTITAIVPTGQFATATAQAENVQAQLAEANITLELEVLESGTYIDRWVAADFEAAIARNGGRPDPDEMYGRYFTSTGNLNHVAGYSSPELDALFEEGRSTTDSAERTDIYRDVSQHLEDNAVWIWLFSGYSYTAMADSLSGFVPMPNGSLQYLRTTTVG